MRRDRAVARLLPCNKGFNHLNPRDNHDVLAMKRTPPPPPFPPMVIAGSASHNWLLATAHARGSHNGPHNILSILTHVTAPICPRPQRSHA
jgi:hypothetical protein